MIKISFKGRFKEVKHFNNKVTIVTLHGEFKGSDKCEFLGWVYDWMAANKIAKRKFGDIIVTGKATCSDLDTFNPVLGERIAESRAKISLYKLIKSCYDKLLKHYSIHIYGHPNVKFVEGEPDSLTGQRNKYEKLLKREQNHLNKLINKYETNS